MVHPMHIDWEKLEGAFVSASAENRAFLLPESGELVWLSEDMHSKERAEIADRLDGEKWCEIDAPNSREVWNWMAAFAETVPSARLRELLEVALNGRGAFRRFKDVLRGEPAIEQQWFHYETEQMRSAIERWVAELGVEVENPPPWAGQTARAADSPMRLAVERPNPHN